MDSVKFNETADTASEIGAGCPAPPHSSTGLPGVGGSWTRAGDRPADFYFLVIL
jgi:hypothetical protein